MKQKLLILLTVILYATAGTSQQARSYKKNIELIFDTAGHLISFPPAIVTGRKEICARVAIPREVIMGQIGVFRQKLEKTFTTFSNKSVAHAYYCYFKNKSADFDDYFNELKTAIEALGEDDLTIDTWAAMSKKVEALKYIPVASFLSKLFYGQYKMKIFRGPVYLRSDSVENVIYDRKTHCFVFQFPCRKIKDLSCTSCGYKQSDQFSFQLTRFDPFTQTLKGWFEANNEPLNKNFEKIDKALSAMAGLDITNSEFLSEHGLTDDLVTWYIDWFWYTGGQIVIDPFETVQPGYIKTLKKLLQGQVKSYDKTIDSLRQQQSFMDTAFKRINPSAGEWEVFQYILDIRQALERNARDLDLRRKSILDRTFARRSTITGAQEDSLKNYGLAIDSINHQKLFIDSSLIKAKNVAGNFQLFKYLQATVARFADQIDSVLSLKDQATKALAAIPSTSSSIPVATYLNNVSIFASDLAHVRPLIQFDANNNFRTTATRKRELHRVTELPDNETGLILLHNVDSSFRIKFDQRRLAFSDDEEFTQWVSEQLDQIDLTKLTAAQIGNLQDFTKSFLKGVDTKGDAGNFSKNCSDTAINYVYRKIKALANAYATGKLTLSYEKSPFSDNQPTVPLYRSESELVKFNAESPFKDSVSIRKINGAMDTLAMQTYVKVGKLRFIQVASGIVMTDHPATVTKIDTVGGGFKMTTTDNKARAVIGFKIYPLQAYSRDRWLIPRYPLRRLSVFGGFEMLHPLDNFYIGGCYDIVPGLGFSIGANFYLQTHYKIENNVVTDTYWNYDTKGLYYSVVVNPKLFVKFVQLFFKTI